MSTFATTHETEEPGNALWRKAGDPEFYSIDEVYEAITLEALNDDYDCEFGIGTDSQMIGRIFRFVTVLCIHRIGKGGTYFYLPEHMPRNTYELKNQKLRMFDEVAKAIEISLDIVDKTGITPIIHVDASPETHNEFTSEFSDQLKGYIQSCGFECKLKPESYVASCVADRHTKKKNRKKERRLRRNTEKR